MPQGNQQAELCIRTRDVHPPAVLYKYTNVETARSILSGGKVRFRSPLDFNDPFDSQWDILWSTKGDRFKNYRKAAELRAMREPNRWPHDCNQDLKAVADGLRPDFLVLSASEQEEKIASMSRDEVAKKNLQVQHERELLDLRRRMRVLCLSESDQAILMWSHYSDQHRGVVLGFDSKRLEQWNGQPLPVEKVRYRDRLPFIINRKAWGRSVVFGSPPKLAIGRKLQMFPLCKHKDWQYEREWRFVWIEQRGTLGMQTDVPFQRDALVEVVSGCKTDPRHSLELFALALAFRSDVRHSRMSMHPSRLELIKSECPLPAER